MRPFSHRIERFIPARTAIRVEGKKKTLLKWDNRELERRAVVIRDKKAEQRGQCDGGARWGE